MASALRARLPGSWSLAGLCAAALALAPRAAPAAEPLVVALTDQERAWLRDHPVITVANDPDWAPVDFTDARGEHAGISADYLKLVEQRLGVALKRVPNLSWQEVYARLQRREIDMAPCMAQTPERTFLAFTKAYVSIPIVIATNADVGYIGDMKALMGRKVAVVKGYAIDDWVTRDLPGIELVRVKNVPDGLAAVQGGQVFAYLDNLLIIGDYQAKLKVTNVKIAGQTPYLNAQRMAVRADWAPLAGILDKALDSISEAERDEIYRRWVPLRYEHGFDYGVLWKVLPAFAAVVLVLVLWNRRLSREIAERKRAEAALRESEERLRLAISAANQGLFDLDVRTGHATVSPEYASMLGYDPVSFRETNASWLERLHPDDRERVTANYLDYVAGRLPVYQVEFRQRTASGGWKWVLSLGKIAERDGEGRPVRMLGTHTDITERKQAEESLRASLAEKTALLQEVHHRVKNNLQVVSSLLSLQAGMEKNRSAVDALRETQGRVRSMALLHEMLYRSEGLARVDFDAYLDRLCAHLLRAIDHHAGRVKLERHGGAVRLGLDQAVPCGLIVSELVSNALKHAFPDGRAGRIVVDVSRPDPGHLSLTVADDGVGLPPEADSGGASTLGLRLVRLLAAQLKGKLTEELRPSASFRVVFPDDSPTPP